MTLQSSPCPIGMPFVGIKDAILLPFGMLQKSLPLIIMLATILCNLLQHPCPSKKGEHHSFPLSLL